MEKRLIEKRLAWIEACLERLRRLGKAELVETDPLQLAFVEHTLQTAIQGAIDVAALVAGARKLGEPDASRSLFQLLAQDGWLEPGQADVWRRIIGFRNIVVHRYLDVDPAIVRAVLETNLGDLSRFVRSIRDRLGRE
ncbi:MAG: DUF86 domain-containing protein [Planctomycetota bacterium]